MEGLHLEKGDREGQWNAKFPRNDRLVCSHEAHVMLANMGNVDWRPCLNLWAVMAYILKYATPTPISLHAEDFGPATDEITY